MMGEGVPKLHRSDSLDNSAEPEPQAWGLTRSIEHAYYARNREEMMRLAWQAEQQIARLRAEIERLKSAGQTEATR